MEPSSTKAGGQSPFGSKQVQQDLGVGRHEGSPNLKKNGISF